MTFNSYYNWSASEITLLIAYDVESIALHEFGHFLHLADLDNPQYSNRAMYGYGSSGQQKRELHEGDRAGIHYIYGRSETATSLAGIALYDQLVGSFYIKEDSTPGVADRTTRYGPAGNDWLPESGKWK